MKKLVSEYLEQTYECVFDSLKDPNYFYFKDKTNNELISLYLLKGIMYKIFGSSFILINECCDEFYENQKQLAIDIVPF